VPFAGLLEQLLAAVPGALGAILVDREGEAVVQAGRIEAYDLQVMGAHQGVVVQQLRMLMDRCGGGRLEELVITGAVGRVLVLPVTDACSLVLALDRCVQLGRARQAARRCASALHQELA
jgi:predicted regulator of Ras-like GTPase activity (Roadblock/LC7/MglB family)